MLRRILAIAVCLNAAPAFAQSAVFTVNVSSADVYKAPSTGSPIIGRAPRGAALPVTRELGSWVKVSWPSAPDGVGFVHVTMGRVANGAPAEAIRAAAGEAVRVTAQETSISGAQTSSATRPVYVTPTHVLGLGGGFVSGSPVGWSATARAWHRSRLGLRVDVARYAAANASTGRFTSMQVEPSVLYLVSDRITRYVWLRPYLGAGLTLRRQTLRGIVGNDPVSDGSAGFQTFGGAEATFASAPQFALSADIGYRSKASAFEGFDIGGFGLSMAANWYLK